MTNREYIDGLSDREFAIKQSYGFAPSEYCKAEEATKCKRNEYKDGLSPCVQCFLEWLKMERTDG